MARLRDERYVASDENHETYEQLYAEYVRLHDLFGRSGVDTMKTLRKVKTQALRTTQPIS